MFHQYFTGCIWGNSHSVSFSRICLVDYGAYRHRDSPANEQPDRASGGRAGCHEDQAGPGSGAETCPGAQYGRMYIFVYTYIHTLNKHALGYWMDGWMLMLD